MKLLSPQDRISILIAMVKYYQNWEEAKREKIIKIIEKNRERFAITPFSPPISEPNSYANFKVMIQNLQNINSQYNEYKGEILKQELLKLISEYQKNNPNFIEKNEPKYE